MITVTIGQATVNYQLCETSAPKAYDGGSVMELFDGGVGKLLYILVREDTLKWQTLRNRSGTYDLVPTDAIPEIDIELRLWKRLSCPD